MTHVPTTVVYNDVCPICSREVNAYRRASEARGLPIRYEGLTSCDLSRLGLTEETAARRFHVLKNGVLLSGVPAFAALWDELPRLGWLARLVRLPGVRQVAALVYDHILAPALYALHLRRQRQKTVSPPPAAR